MTDVAVRCGGCHTCCQLAGLIVNLDPAADPVATYRTYTEGGEQYVAKGADGACVYLTAQGCSVYATRPKVCREFSCARYLHPTYWDQYNEATQRETIRPMRRAARACVGRHKQSLARRFNALLSHQPAQ